MPIVAQYFLQSLTLGLLGLLSSLLIGIVWMIPLLSLSERHFRLVESLTKTIFLMPTILVILVISKIPGLENQGILKTVLCFCFLNSPFLGISLAKAWMGEGRRLKSVLQVSGQHQFLSLYFKMFWNQCSHSFWLVGMFCFTSFAIPLVFGGPFWRTMEVGIYDLVFKDFNLKTALVWSLLQWVFLVLMLIFAPSKSLTPPLIFPKRSSFAGLVAFLILFFFWIGPLIPTKMLSIEWLSSLIMSIQLALSVSLIGGFIFLIFMFLATHRIFFPKILLNGVGAIPTVSISLLVLMGSVYLGYLDSFITSLFAQFLMGFPWIIQTMKLSDYPTWNRLVDIGVTSQGTYWNQFRKVYWPFYAPILTSAMLFFFLLSIGDVAAVSLTWQDPVRPLSLLMMDRLSRFDILGAEEIGCWIFLLFMLIQFFKGVIHRENSA